jgi:enolase
MSAKQTDDPSIASVHAREIIDSRGIPTVEVDVRLRDGSFGRAAVPSGSSRGSAEAVELRDGDPERYEGLGVDRAVDNVNRLVAPTLIGVDAFEQATVDFRLTTLDGTREKSRLGANAILGVSLAVARAAADSANVPLFKQLAGGGKPRLLPVPLFNVLNGGAHADTNVDFEEFMIVPIGAPTFRQALRIGSEIFHSLRKTLLDRGHSTGVGDEGGFAPVLQSNVEALELLMRAIESARYRPGQDVVLALDVAANQLYDGEAYLFRRSGGKRQSSDEMIAMYVDLVQRFPIWSIEDCLAERDWGGWQRLTATLGDRVQLVGDDIFATDRALISRAVEQHVGTAALIKPNQIGTVTATREAIGEARAGNYGTIVSHRSGDTPDDFIADLAVALWAGQIKAGAPCRGERTAKYNQLLRIEEALGEDAIFAGAMPFRPKPHAIAASDLG